MKKPIHLWGKLANFLQLNKKKSPCTKNNTKTKKKPSLKSKFPLQVDDVIVLQTDERYRIKKKSVRGHVAFVTYFLEPLEEISDAYGTYPTRRFTTLRELNDYVVSKRQYLENIIVNSPRKKQSSVDECHEEALEIEKKREGMEEWLTTLRTHGSK